MTFFIQRFKFCFLFFFLLQAPPNQIKPDERRQAEAVFHSFRAAGGKDIEGLKLCQYILGKSLSLFIPGLIFVFFFV